MHLVVHIHQEIHNTPKLTFTLCRANNMQYLPFLTFIFIAAFTPGPNNCMALSHAARGLKNGVVFSCGVFGGMLIVMLSCAFLSGFLAQHLSDAVTAMKIIGGSYMVWLAWSLWRSCGTADTSVQSTSKLLLSGCFLQLVNPKLIAYGLTAFSVFILPKITSTAALALFAALLAFVGFAGTITWAFGGAALQKIFQTHPVFINRILSVTVLGCAVSMFV